MSTAEALWRENLERLGGYIRAQRQFHQLSQRQLASLAELSDTYMSQLERGLHEPSVRVLRALAEGLGLDPSHLIMQAAGLSPDDAAVTTEQAINADDRFTEAQKRALLGVVQSYLDANNL
jgi:transcriptional regulator with XRE-family HTH domain